MEKETHRLMHDNWEVGPIHYSLDRRREMAHHMYLCKRFPMTEEEAKEIRDRIKRRQEQIQRMKRVSSETMQRRVRRDE